MPTTADRFRVKVYLAAVAAILFWLPAALVQPPPAAQEPAKPADPAPASSPTPAVTSTTSVSGAVDYVKEADVIFDAFYGTGLNTSQSYAVSNLTIRKDNMVFLLRSGTVFLANPIAGEITGAAFIGDGEAQMTPPNRTERYMLNKYYGAEVLKEPFAEAVFRFSDGTDKTIVGAGRLDPAGGSAAARAADVFADRNGWLNGTRSLANRNRSLYLELQFLENRLSNLQGADFFVADFHSPKHNWLSYRHNPHETAENILYTTQTLGAKNRRYIIPWSEWHKASDYGAGGHYLILPDRDGPRALRVRHLTMEMNLPTTKTVQWEAKLQIEPLASNLRAFRFDLVNNAFDESRWYDTGFFPTRVLSVTDEAGQVLKFIHKKDQLLVFLAEPTRAGAPMTLAFKGAADVIYQVTAESFGLLQAPWYPQYGYAGGRSTFDWTIRVPKPFLITGSGNVVREFQDKEMMGVQLRSEQPVTFPWVIFGRFQKATNSYVGEESKKTVGLSIHSFPTMTVSITDPEILEELGASTPVTMTLSAPVKRVNGFFDEGKEVLKLYEKIYGPYPYAELHVAQMGPFVGYGQGPPGFVQLTGEAFMSATGGAKVGDELVTFDYGDFIHGFFAHEIAHQWWGNQIGWASEDDEWLSEGFAEYASGLFVKELQGAKRFQRTLEEWRRDAKYSDKEAPIAAANTLSGPNGPDHREKLLYAKAPYVLHMLRVQLDDTNYVKVMRGLHENYRHQNISTEMFLREVNKITGSDYTSFFDQWFWDVGIPTFKYSWRSEKQPDGKVLVTLHLSQEDKTRVKKVLMPVYLHFKDNKTIPQYKPVIQAEQDIKFMLPEAPKNVTLDDERTLLAEFVKAD